MREARRVLLCPAVEAAAARRRCERRCERGRGRAFSSALISNLLETVGGAPFSLHATMSLGRKDTAGSGARRRSAVYVRTNFGAKTGFLPQGRKDEPSPSLGNQSALGENSLRGSFPLTALFYSQRGATRQPAIHSAQVREGHVAQRCIINRSL